MKILKQGKSKEEVNRIIKRVRQFECSICGCVFEADDTEYKYQFCQREAEEWWECKCPNCGKIINKSFPYSFTGFMDACDWFDEQRTTYRFAKLISSQRG